MRGYSGAASIFTRAHRAAKLESKDTPGSQPLQTRKLSSRLVRRSLPSAQASISPFRFLLSQLGPRRYLSYLSSQLTFNQALHAVEWGPAVRNLEAHGLKKLVPLPLRAFLRSQIHHHHKIERRRLPVSPSIGHHVLVDQDFAISGRHRADKLPEDLLVRLIVPIVENGMQEINASPYRRTIDCLASI